MQFESFHWLSHHGTVYEPLYYDLQKWRASAWFFGPFWFYCSLVFYILGAFLINQLFHSCLLDMRWLPTRRYAPRWLSIISYLTRTHGIIVNYTLYVVYSGHVVASCLVHSSLDQAVWVWALEHIFVVLGRTSWKVVKCRPDWPFGLYADLTYTVNNTISIQISTE